MSTFLFVRGLEPVELEDNFNLVRQRLNEVLTGTNRDGSEDNSNKPMQKVSFKTAEGGRIAVVPEHIIGVGSDTRTDSDDD